MIKIIIVIVVAAIFCIILKHQKSDMHYMLSAIATVLVCIAAIKNLTPILDYTKNTDAVSSDVLEILIKVLGISYLTDFSSSICKDLGESGLAAGAELCGKVEILVLSLPIFTRLLDLCTNLIN